MLRGMSWLDSPRRESCNLNFKIPHFSQFEEAKNRVSHNIMDIHSMEALFLHTQRLPYQPDCETKPTEKV